MNDDLRHFHADDYEGDLLQAGVDAIVLGSCVIAFLLGLAFS